MSAVYRLYNYFRSSSSQRVRIALALKGVAYEYLPVHLVKDGGQQWTPAYLAKSPTAMVPLLEIADPAGPQYLGESLAIIEYLDEQYPEPPLMPADAYGRGRARMLAEIIATGIQPLQNLKVLGRVKRLGGDGQAWAREFIAEGLLAFQTSLPAHRGAFCLGATPMLPDLCLVPQLHAARRFAVDLAPLARLVAIDAACQAMPAFKSAAPESQPDAE
jgi:maleylpyruvate isomerase